MKKLLFCSLLIVLCTLLTAFDFELVLDQTADYVNTKDDDTFGLEGSFVAKVSGLLSHNGNYIVSMGISNEDDPWAVIPELIEAGLFFGFNAGNFCIGRTYYQDPLGFIVNGYFDGAQVSYDTSVGIFSAGALYTGLINKKRANIEMTEQEQLHNISAIKYDDFANTYFAPNRAVVALEWAHPLVTQHLRLGASFLGQFDFTDEKLDSQYIIAKITMPFRGFSFDLGGCFSLIQHSGESEAAIAAQAGLNWYTQKQGISFLARYSGGNNGSFVPFLPVTTVTQGNVYEAKLTGLTMFSLDYNVRLGHNLFFNISPACFIDNYDSDGGLLGTEIYGKLNWSPFTDIMLGLGGGVFINQDDDNIWKIELSFVVSFI